MLRAHERCASAPSCAFFPKDVRRRRWSVHGDARRRRRGAGPVRPVVGQADRGLRRPDACPAHGEGRGRGASLLPELAAPLAGAPVIDVVAVVLIGGEPGAALAGASNVPAHCSLAGWSGVMAAGRGKAITFARRARAGRRLASQVGQRNHSFRARMSSAGSPSNIIRHRPHWRGGSSSPSPESMIASTAATGREKGTASRVTKAPLVSAHRGRRACGGR